MRVGFRDPDLDIFKGNLNQASKIWNNNGLGTFVVSPQVLTAHGTNSVALGDVDKDGDLDVFQGNQGDSSFVLINQ